jgi:uncharacterized membrane protein
MGYITSMADTSSAPAAAPLFAARITPNLSLGATGNAVVIGALAILNFGAGALFWAKGAWPVVPFLGLDVFLVWFAFRAYRRKAEAFEEVRLTASELLVRRVFPQRAAEEHRFDPHWVRLVRRTEEDVGLTRLMLTSHGRSLVIAGFLSPPERESFARALESALQRLKSGI